MLAHKAHSVHPGHMLGIRRDTYVSEGRAGRLGPDSTLHRRHLGFSHWELLDRLGLWEFCPVNDSGNKGLLHFGDPFRSNSDGAHLLNTAILNAQLLVLARHC